MNLVNLTPLDILMEARKDWKRNHYYSKSVRESKLAPEPLNQNGWFIYEDFSGAGDLDTEDFYHQLGRFSDDDVSEKTIIGILGDCNFARSVLPYPCCDECDDKFLRGIRFSNDCFCGGIQLCAKCLSRAWKLLAG